MLYLDNAATTPVLPEVRDVMLNYIADNYGNPSSIYKIGRMNKIALEEARKIVAETIGSASDEVFFTSGGTESDNWVLESALTGSQVHDTTGGSSGKKGHIIVSSIEHPAIMNKCRQLEKRGYKVTYVKVHPNGIINMNDLVSHIQCDTRLISVMLVNNEIGTIQPVKGVCNIAAEYGIPVHTDAVAAYGHIPVNVNELGVDYMSVSAHKIGGAKGVGFLYARSGNISPLICGGGQERGMRSGTENVAGIIGLATAARISQNRLKQRIQEEMSTRNYITNRILREVKGSALNGDYKYRISGNMNFRFDGINGGELVIMLDKDGICVSAGSACASGSIDPSHVLLATGVPKDIAKSSIRMTIGEDITKEEADYAVDELKAVVERLRSMSPEYAEYIASQS